MFTTLTATITPPGPANTITWYRNGIVVPGASGSTLRVGVDELGLYTARVTTALNCTALSNAVNIKDSASNRLFITPNPNSGVFQVRYYSGSVNPGTTRTLVIYGNNGQRVYIKSFPVTAPYNVMDVRASFLSGGMYVIAVTDSNAKVLATGKVIVK